MRPQRCTMHVVFRKILSSWKRVASLRSMSSLIVWEVLLLMAHRIAARERESPYQLRESVVMVTFSGYGSSQRTHPTLHIVAQHLEELKLQSRTRIKLGLKPGRKPLAFRPMSPTTWMKILSLEPVRKLPARAAVLLLKGPEFFLFLKHLCLPSRNRNYYYIKV